jgi:hypothetical protein
VATRILAGVKAGPAGNAGRSGDVMAAQPHRVAAQAAETGRAILDAPVSGGTVGAEAGTLAIMVGGEAHDFEQAKEILQSNRQLMNFIIDDLLDKKILYNQDIQHIQNYKMNKYYLDYSVNETKNK